MKSEEKNTDHVLLVKFITTGISGVGVNFTSLFLLLYIFNHDISVAIAIYLSMTSNYFINRSWTFKSNNSWLKEYFKYILSALTGSIIQYIVTIYLFKLITKNGISQFIIPILEFKLDIIYLTSIIGIGLGFITNFIISKKFVFN